ncbi:MAG: hypothetical protein CMF52_00110 [Legionellales bacterium]|nr:hypothetical protein [Legionellales bacterium]
MAFLDRLSVQSQALNLHQPAIHREEVVGDVAIHSRNIKQQTGIVQLPYVNRESPRRDGHHGTEKHAVGVQPDDVVVGRPVKVHRDVHVGLGSQALFVAGKRKGRREGFKVLVALVPKGVEGDVGHFVLHFGRLGTVGYFGNRPLFGTRDTITAAYQQSRGASVHCRLDPRIVDLDVHEEDVVVVSGKGDQQSIPAVVRPARVGRRNENGTFVPPHYQDEYK